MEFKYVLSLNKPQLKCGFKISHHAGYWKMSCVYITLYNLHYMK